MSFDEILDVTTDVFYFIIMFKVNNSSQQELLLSCWFFDHVPSKMNKLWLLLCYLRVPFQLASPPGFHVTHPEGEPCIHVFFWPFGIFFSSGRGSFLVLSAPWHAGSQPGPRTQVWALAEVRGTCSGGSKSQVRSGRDSERVAPSKPLQTHVQVKRISDVSCDIWHLECHQCRQTILGDGKAFPPHQHARHATTFNTIRIFMTSEGYYRSLLTHMTTRWLGLSPATHSCTSIIPWYKQLNWFTLTQDNS